MEKCTVPYKNKDELHHFEEKLHKLYGFQFYCQKCQIRNIFGIHQSCSNCARVQIIFTALHCWDNGTARTNSATERIIVPYLLADKSSSPFFLWKLERKLLRNLSILQQFGITISYLCLPDLLEMLLEPRIRSNAFCVRILWCTVPTKYIRYLCP